MFRYQGSIFLEEVHLHAVYRPHPSSFRAWTNRQSSYRHVVCKKVGKPCTQKEKNDGINEFGSNLIFISSISSILPCTTTLFLSLHALQSCSIEFPKQTSWCSWHKVAAQFRETIDFGIGLRKVQGIAMTYPNLRNLKQLLYPWPSCYSPRYLKSMRGNKKEPVNNQVIINCW